jgi:HlyD family secretion protein
LAQAEADYARKNDLVQKQLIARSDFDLATAARDQARAQLAAANANIRQQQAALDSARVDLGHTDIVSPVDGVILARSVEPGQTVAASFQTPVLFKIAEDLREMQIVLAVDEADIGQVKPGQEASFSVDAFPDRRFEGKVQQVRLDATNTANVITYPVVVSVDNADLSLLPGMTVNAEIEVSHRDGVLRVPNAALRYKPADDVVASATATRSGGGLADELPGIAAELKLTGAQQAAFDAALAAMRERFAARAAAAKSDTGGSALFGRGPGGPTPGGGNRNGGNDGAIRQRMLERYGQQFAEFRATLTAEQQAQWDGALSALVGARRAPVYKLVDGKPQPVTVRIGVSDGSFTEVIGDLHEGDVIVVGSGRSSQ